MNPTTNILSAALAFCDALLTDGPAVYADGGVIPTLVIFPDFPDSWPLDCMKGHPEKLQARRDAIAAALARV
jgi:hypothetical protein